MNRINLYSILIRIHILLIAITVFGSIYVIVIKQPSYLLAFITIPLVNILLLPLTSKEQKFDPTHPILLILVSLLIGTVLRSFFILSPLQSDAKFLMLLGEPPAILMKGIFAIYLGLISFIIGYIYSSKPFPDWSKTGIFKDQINMKKFVPLAVIITIVSMITAYLYFQKVGVNFSDISAVSQKRRYKLDNGSYTSLGYYLLLMDLAGPVYYILLIYLIRNRKSFFSFLGIFTLFLCLLNLIYPFVRSSRSDALYVIIYSGLIFYYLRGGIKISRIAYFALIGSIILVIMTTLRRDHAKVRSTKLEAQTNPLVIMVGSLNFLGVDKTSQIIDKMPSRMNYKFGTTLFLWTLAPIPHTLWLNKPDIRIGLEVGEKIYQKRDQNDPGGGVPPGFIAELYMNFSYMGIIAGMFLFGNMLKLFYEALKKIRTISIFGMVIYIQAFIPFGLKLIGGDLTGVTVNAFSTIIPIFLMMKLTQKNQNEPQYLLKSI